MKAGRRLARFQPRETQNAFFRFAGGPVIESLFIRTGGHTHAPAPAFFLIDEHDAVFAALVDCPRWPRRHTTSVEAVIADARQIEENQPLDFEQLFALLWSQHFKIWIIGRIDWRTTQVII